MTLSRSLYRSFALLLALLLFLTGFSLFNFRRLSDADAWKVHTFQVLQSLHRYQSDLSTMDSGVRGSIVENSQDALKLYQQGTRDSDDEFSKLSDLTKDNPKHQQHLHQIQVMRQAWINDYLEPALALRRTTSDNMEAIRITSKLAAGRLRAMIKMLDIIGIMERDEEALLVQRADAQRHWQNLTQITLWVGSGFSILLALMLAALVSGATKKLDVANERLIHSNSKLEATNTQLAEKNTQMLAANERLNLEVGQRRAAEAKLQHSVAELERSNAELAQFAYVASHDLQEPLRAVAGCVQVLKKRYAGQLDARADQFIEHAVEGAQRMQNLINDLLSYSRVGTQGKPFEPVNMEKVLARATQNISEALQDSQVNITHDPLPQVVGDAGQLEQVLQNLLSNAVKFRSQNEPHVHLSYRYREEDEHHVFGVRDNGPGIEPQYFERIFVMFQRLHTRAEYPGTGIGLAICKKIVERHRGKIWVESAPGEGSTFWFSLALDPNVDKDATGNESLETNSLVETADGVAI